MNITTISPTEIMDYAPDNIQDLDSVMLYLQTATTPLDFDGSKRRRPTLQHDTWLITPPMIYTYFQDNDNKDLLILTERKLHQLWKQLIKANKPVQMYEPSYTYNWGSYVSHDLTDQSFRLPNDCVLTFFRFHTGLDARTGFSPAFAIVFEDDSALEDFYEYRFDSWEILFPITQNTSVVVYADASLDDSQERIKASLISASNEIETHATDDQLKIWRNRLEQITTSEILEDVIDAAPTEKDNDLRATQIANYLKQHDLPVTTWQYTCKPN